MSEELTRKISPVQTLALIGFGFGLLVFAGGMMIGISIDPRVDLASRLLAYTMALIGLTVAFACRWAGAERAIERIFYMALTLTSLTFSVVYGFVML